MVLWSGDMWRQGVSELALLMMMARALDLVSARSIVSSHILIYCTMYNSFHINRAMHIP